MASSPLRLSLSESSNPDKPRSRALNGLDPDPTIAVPTWVQKHVQAEAWTGPRLPIKALSQAAKELEENLVQMGRTEVLSWLWDEDTLEIDPTLVFLILARDLCELGVRGDLAIGG